MASWNGDGGNRQYQQNYGFQPQNGFYGDNYQQPYYLPSNPYQYQNNYQGWYNSQSNSYPAPYESQNYIPSHVYHNSSQPVNNGETASGRPPGFSGEVSNNRSNGAIPKQTRGGSNRSYRNNYQPQAPSQYRRETGMVVEGSKAEDKQKLLAEVATLLTKDKRVMNNSTHSRGPKDGGRSGLWQNRSTGDSKEYRPSPQRAWEATSNRERYHDGPSLGKRMDGGGGKRVIRKEPENQRERLADQLTRAKLECLVCCDKLRQNDAVWSCQNCYHVLHLECTTKWALASTTKIDKGILGRDDLSWRCPACQHVYEVLPTRYTCFCTKVNAPKWVKGETPHCCGDVCGRKKNCPHPCTLLCHPGPCPPCSALVNRCCGCGKSVQSVVCSSTLEIQCDMLCAKLLDCGTHDCLQICHHGPCQPCSVTTKQKCFCGNEEKEGGCGAEPEYSCGGVCGRDLTCEAHKCQEVCHPGSCSQCPADPSLITTCHCGAQPVPRTSCTEPVPSCGKPCPLPRSCPHPCPSPCHPSPCPPCQVPVSSPCRCRHSLDLTAPCHVITSGQYPLCKKKCTKKRSCARHKCNQECCNEPSHPCPLPCNKTLTCGRHRCELSCHKGNCPTCTRLSFDELRCECGRSVVYPPVDCGTRVPECSGPCPRQHSCPHPPTHSCHSDATCPPCTVLVSRQCYGKHETRKAVACYVAEYSCGLPCSKVLPCQHKCVERCHGGVCPSECKQFCPVGRPACGHPCALPCHVGKPCGAQPPCLARLQITCTCGRRSHTITCTEYWKTYGRSIAAEQASSHQTISINTNRINLKVLECDDECKLYQRNLKLAIGLQIANPDLSSKLKPQYSEFMRNWAKRDPRFADHVFQKLTQLVQLAKESKQKSRSFSFDVMSAQKRQFVHEYCKHFGCESVAYDAEPKRNVVATAYKDKCWLPSYSLLEVLQRESGQRKIPIPTLNRKDSTPLVEKSGCSSVSSAWREGCGRDSGMVPLNRGGSTGQARPPLSPPPAAPAIDYFDFTPTSAPPS